MNDTSDDGQGVREGLPGRATGPRTQRGKARSSANGTTLGLTGRALVLPGESVAAYRRHQQAWFSTLPCASEAEAHLVAQLGDIGWRQQRLLRLEHAHQLELVENAVKRSVEFDSQALALRALTAVNVLVGHAAAATHLEPFPCTEGQLRPFVAAARGTGELVAEVEGLDHRLVKGLEEAVDALEAAADASRAKAEHMVVLALAAQELQKRLAGRVKRGKASLAKLRKVVAAGLVPPDDRQGRVLARYRAEMEKSQSRLLDTLDKVRAQQAKAVAAVRTGGGKAVDLRLRVVR